MKTLSIVNNQTKNQLIYLYYDVCVKRIDIDEPSLVKMKREGRLKMIFRQDFLKG